METNPFFWQLLLSAAIPESGHVCFELDSLAGKRVPETPFSCPEKNDWLRTLKSSPVVGSPGSMKPMILEDDSWLYLYRYWRSQEYLADQIQRRLSRNAADSQTVIEALEEGINRYFPPTDTAETDWQKIAAGIAVMNPFCVISGGPGTGKTTTITRILALIAEEWALRDHGRPLRIRLVAPTGKAAARLMASVAESKQLLDCDNGIKGLIPDEATTIHRLLGTVKHSPHFRYNEKRQLPADVVVVDEASMVDLSLMSRLMLALPEKCRLILLGDQNQLASVEAGAVLADICNTGEPRFISEPFKKRLAALTGSDPGDESVQDGGRFQTGDCIAVLKRSYRFDAESGIKRLSDAVNSGKDDAFLISQKHRRSGISPSEIFPVVRTWRPFSGLV